MAGNGENRVSKRSPYACTRCKRQKIKCSGQQPCANCAKRNLACVVNESEIKVVVTKGYLSALQARAARLEQTEGIPSQSPSPGPPVSQLPPGNRGEHHRLPSTRHYDANSTTGIDVNDTVGEASNTEDDTDLDASKLANPLSITAAPKYMSSSKGLKSYLGPSSNWSFHGRVLNLVHTHSHRTPFPSSDFLFEGEAYGLPWNNRRDSLAPETALVPSIDHAVFLVNAVKFHCTQLFHLFDEAEFNEKLQLFYSSADAGAEIGLWYIHFLFVISLGKAVTQNKQQSLQPAGSELFQQAQRLLPDTDTLCRDPMAAMELLCCAALYLHALDSRNAAHVTIGQAMRIGQANGMHTDMPVQDLGEPLVQRCRKIWWTSIRTYEITCQLPDFTGSPHRLAALQMQISLSHVYADIARYVYGPDQRLHKDFVTNVRSVLDTLTALAEQTRTTFTLQTNRGMSRTAAHLHLQHLQLVVLVIRPILFCCLELHLRSPADASHLTASAKVRHLINVSSDAAQSMISILSSLQEQGLLENFLPWDFDALFVSTFVLILIQFIDSTIRTPDSTHLGDAFKMFEYMAGCGNDIAAHRVRELRGLRTMLQVITATSSQQPGRQETVNVSTDSSDQCIDLTAEQILTMADDIEIEETDWMSLLMFEPGYAALEV